jgi:hypothetical protein
LRCFGTGEFGFKEAAAVEIGFECGDLGGALILDDFDNLHGGFEASGGGGVFIAKDLSQSVARELREPGEFIE